jgi:hypothetical protein
VHDIRPSARQQHPNTLGALAALAALRDAWRYLPDMIEPGSRRQTTRTLGPAAIASLNRLHRAERADLTDQQRHGLAPKAPSPAPLRVAVLDAQILAAGLATDAAWTCSSALRTRPMLGYVMPAGDDHARFTAAAGYLAVALLLIHPDLAGTLGADLDAAARTCLAAADLEPDRHRLDVSCPACGRRSLDAVTVDMGSAATVTCSRPDCRCHGVDCLCRRPFRQPGARHIWPGSEFEQLKKVLRRQVAA